MNFRGLVLGLLMGAASFGCVNSSPRFENGLYSDHCRDICFSTPNTWRQVKEFPNSFELTPNQSKTSCELNRAGDLIFMSSQANGVIVVQINHSDINAQALSPQQLGALVQEVQVSRRDILAKAYQITDYHFSTTPNRVTGTPVCMASEQFNYGTAKTFSSELFVFSNNLGNTCCVRVMLFSDKASAGENQLACERLVGTIKRLNTDKDGRKELVSK